MDADSEGGDAPPSATYGSDAAAAAAAFRTFRTLVESADRKFARVRDLPPYGRGPHLLHYYRKVFRAYTSLWRFQQERRGELVGAGLRRWEIGEIASRIGQLYYTQYLRTSEVRYLLEAYVFYEAILNRGYFEAGKGSLASSSSARTDLGLRYKELRFHARFLIVAMLLNRTDAVKHLAERFRALVEESKAAHPETNFKEWKLVLQEIFRFLKANTAFTNTRPLRYSILFDSHLSSVPYIARFHANRVLRLQDALLTSYHHNEVKFTELTLDTFRMLQCLEWEPSGSFYQTPPKEPTDNGAFSDLSGASGLIDINLSADMTDPSLPPNPRKAIIYHPSVSHLIAVIATICEELSSDNILLIYVSASGRTHHNTVLQKDISGSLLNFSRPNRVSQTSHKQDSSLPDPPVGDKPDSNSCLESYLCLGPRGSGGFNNLYPEDLLPFTRRPLFLIIDSDNSHAFKAIHGAERGEAAALLLSPERPSSVFATDLTLNGSQFTYFLTAPLQAFCQLVGLSSDVEADVYRNAEGILSSALAEWEVILCTCNSLNQVWAQVLPDPFLRRLILRFIFCWAVLHLFRPIEKSSQHLPACIPSLPESVSPSSAKTQVHILQLAENFGVIDHFHFSDSIRDSVPNR
ncbi:protein SCAI homolog [Phoenix dactylifera]|uniref:Protein SCAI homolog n=1 Tax=Phoenix dactylifera TaxID=42345 RepID=A0A8B7CTB3_PHODC|nr:protein SCAI homolog [Phoenix dactylifera]